MDAATQIAHQTKDAHSFDRYGMQEWIACALMLLTMLKPNEAECILRSKHMRWARDHKEDGELSSAAFMRYLVSYKKQIISDAALWAQEAEADRRAAAEGVQEIALRLINGGTVTRLEIGDERNMESVLIAIERYERNAKVAVRQLRDAIQSINARERNSRGG